MTLNVDNPDRNISQAPADGLSAKTLQAPSPSRFERYPLDISFRRAAVSRSSRPHMIIAETKDIAAGQRVVHVLPLFAPGHEPSECNNWRCLEALAWESSVESMISETVLAFAQAIQNAETGWFTQRLEPLRDDFESIPGIAWPFPVAVSGQVR